MSITRLVAHGVEKNEPVDESEKRKLRKEEANEQRAARAGSVENSLCALLAIENEEGVHSSTDKKNEKIDIEAIAIGWGRSLYKMPRVNYALVV